MSIKLRLSLQRNFHFSVSLNSGNLSISMKSTSSLTTLEYFLPKLTKSIAFTTSSCFIHHHFRWRDPHSRWEISDCASFTSMMTQTPCEHEVSAKSSWKQTTIYSVMWSECRVWVMMIQKSKRSALVISFSASLQCPSSPNWSYLLSTNDGARGGGERDLSSLSLISIQRQTMKTTMMMAAALKMPNMLSHLFSLTKTTWQTWLTADWHFRKSAKQIR